MNEFLQIIYVLIWLIMALARAAAKNILFKLRTISVVPLVPRSVINNSYSIRNGLNHVKCVSSLSLQYDEKKYDRGGNTGFNRMSLLEYLALLPVFMFGCVKITECEMRNNDKELEKCNY